MISFLSLPFKNLLSIKVSKYTFHFYLSGWPYLKCTTYIFFYCCLELIRIYNLSIQSRSALSIPALSPGAPPTVTSLWNSKWYTLIPKAAVSVSVTLPTWLTQFYWTHFTAQRQSCRKGNGMGKKPQKSAEGSMWVPAKYWSAVSSEKLPEAREEPSERDGSLEGIIPQLGIVTVLLAYKNNLIINDISATEIREVLPW